MSEVIIDRAQEVLVRLHDRMAAGDPNGLYHDTAQAIENLVEACTAAREVIASLKQRLDPTL